MTVAEKDPLQVFMDRLRRQRTPNEELAAIERTHELGEAADPVDQMVAAEGVGKLHAALNTLKPRYRLVVKLRNGIGTEGGRTYTQKEIAGAYGVSHERVGQMEHKSLKDMWGLGLEGLKPAEVDNRDVYVFEKTRRIPGDPEFDRLVKTPMKDLHAQLGN